MNQKTKSRVLAFGLIFIILLGVFSVRLYTLQHEDADAQPATADTITYRTTVEAARGNILDRNGNVLVSNRASYNLTIINFVLLRAEDPNTALLSLLDTCDSLGISYDSHFPVTSTRPYTYEMENYSSSWQDYFRTFLSNRDYDLDMSASTLMKNLRSAYKIPANWTQEQVYKVISVRYELELRSLDGVGLENYTLAEDVDSESLAAIMELGVPGVIVETGTVREYHTTYAAHLLGTTGQMTAEEYETYSQNGYAMNAIVGKSGVELAFEDELHGTSGTKYTTVTSDGSVVSQELTSEPQPGNNVELSIDLNLQMVAEDALEDVILNLRKNGVSTGEGKDAEGGAVVVLDCKTNEVLASASYPTYDLSTYNQNYTELSEDKLNPLWNRALSAAYPPGSIFKMVTATAAIDLGGIGSGYEITDKGQYDYYKDQGYAPVCQIWTTSGHTRTHGTINMMQALSVSCNYYFYEAGRLTYTGYHDKTGLDPIDLVAKSLGLGEATGVELPESTGSRANAESKAAAYTGDEAGWYGADVLQDAIGQSLNRYTPMQLACYASALANKGVRYNASFLSRVVSWDYSTVIEEHTPTVASTWEMSDAAYQCIVSGMHLCQTEGTASTYLKDYPISVCCKTGTAQWQGAAADGSVSGSDNASFVLFAPADDPQIAIAVYVEKGAQGGNLANVCIPILDAYFSDASSQETALTENTVH